MLEEGRWGGRNSAETLETTYPGIGVMMVKTSFFFSTIVSGVGRTNLGATIAIRKCVWRP